MDFNCHFKDIAWISFWIKGSFTAKSLCKISGFPTKKSDIRISQMFILFLFFFRTLDPSNEGKVKEGVTSQSWTVSFSFIRGKMLEE